MTWTVFCPCGISTRFSIDHARQLVAPDRQPELEPELDQVLRAIGDVRAGDLVLVAEPEHLAIRQPHALEQVIQHHHAAERRRQRGDEQAVIPARDDAGDRARRVAAEPVRDEPLAARRRIVAFAMIVRTRE